MLKSPEKINNSLLLFNMIDPLFPTPSKLMKHPMLSLLVGALLLLSSVSAAEVVLQRGITGSKATIGKLSVNGESICEFLEYPTHPPFKFLNPGTYAAYTRADGSKGWRIELKDTAPFTHIQIHVGNSLPDSEGCLLAGYNADAERPWVADSKKAMTAIKKAVDAAGGNLTVTIKAP